MSKYAIVEDYGTLSERALLVNIETGEEAATSVYEYPHGVMEEHLPTGERLPSGWALQEPQDYVEGLILTIRNVLAEKKVLPEEVIGIGVDFTSSTVIPVKSDRTPLCHLENCGNIMAQKKRHFRLTALQKNAVKSGFHFTAEKYPANG